MDLVDLARARTEASGTIVRTALGEMHARVKGDGPPLLLLHGITESVETFHDLQECLSHLASVHALDLPGHGHSDIPREPLSFDRMAEWVEAYMDVAKLDRAVVAGWSLGGGVALSLAKRAPARVSAMVLLGSVAPGMPMPRNLGLLRHPFVAELVVRAARRPAFRRALLRDVYHSSFTPSDAIVDRHWKAWRVRGRTAYIRALLRTADVSPLEDCLPHVRAKTIVVHGKDDRLVPFAHARRMAERIEGAELHALEHTGHAPHLEEPAHVRRVLRTALAHARRSSPAHGGGVGPLEP